MKAILVLDEMPDCCIYPDCPLSGMNAETEEYFCSKTRKRTVEEWRPDWCPLKELPERKPDDPIEQGKTAEKEDLPVDWFQAYCTGFNACLDRILGTED